jgi:hypothetical protein
MLRLTSSVGVAVVTVASVLAWYLLVAGIAFAFARGTSDAAAPLLFLLAVPVLPGGSICMVVGAQRCLPSRERSRKSGVLPSGGFHNPEPAGPPCPSG